MTVQKDYSYYIRGGRVGVLLIHGLGDFEFKVPGPALDVQGLPGTQDEPGLRKGAVLWQGFSPGRKVLGASMELHPNLEADRLPVRFTLSITVRGRPLEPGERRSGPFRMSISMRNVSAVPVQIRRATADPAAVAPALDAISRSLTIQPFGGRARPQPGRLGIPKVIPVRSQARPATAKIEAAFELHGAASFPTGSVSGVRVNGTPARSRTIEFGGMLGGGDPMKHEVTIIGSARFLGMPSLQVSALPVPPLASVVKPPRAAVSWAEAAASGRVDGETMLWLAETTMWRVALLSPFDAYLGNPDPTGPSRTTYRYVLAPPVRTAAASAVSGGGIRPLGVVLFALAALVLLFLLAAAWVQA